MARWHALPLGLLVALTLTAGGAAQERFGDFTRPGVHDFRLDFCRHAGRECGQPAADLFCQQMGYERASAWTPSGPVSVQTLIFGDGAICSGPNCSAFNQIRCVAGQPISPPTPGTQIMVPAAPQPTIAPSQTILLAPPTQIAPQPLPRPQSLQPVIPPIAAVPLPRARPENAAAIVPNTVELAPPPVSLALNPDFAQIASPPPVRSAPSTSSRSSQAVAIRWADTIRQMGVYPGGARIYKCLRSDCEFAVDYDTEIDPFAEDQYFILSYSVSKVPLAGGALWQVSYLPFPAFANASDADFAPPGLLFSGRQDRVSSFYEFDLKAIAENLPDFPRAGAEGHILHFRILPVASSGFGQIIGQPSNVMRVYYGAKLPEQPPIVIYSPEIVAEAPPVQLVSLEFKPYRNIDWPAGCLQWEDYRDSLETTFLEDVGNAFADIWNFAADAYQWAKDRVVDIASALTFGVIPESVLEFALNTALAAAGIPPDIPNLDEMISGGIDQLAVQMAKAAVSQIPAADLAVSLGNVAADIGVNVAAGMAEDELRERLQDELERRSREALVRASDELEAAASTPNNDALCENRFIPPSYRLTLVNTGPDRLQGISVGVSDSVGVYLGLSQDVDLRPHQTLSLMMVPEPNIVDVWDNRLMRMEPMATSENESHWWNDILFGKPTVISVSLPGHTECLGTCTTLSRQVLRSPPQHMTEPYYGEPIRFLTGVTINLNP
ncbi:MAG: hypothetical protein WEB63_02715 [Cucumibacter sp.]